jgi:hypothetical protein
MTSPESGPAAGAGGRGSLLVRGGHVITMDPATGDIPGGDVPVSDGTIAAVGTGPAVPPGTRVLEATGMIVARPGGHALALLEEGGVLTALDAARIGRDARRALDGVIARSRSAPR